MGIVLSPALRDEYWQLWESLQIRPSRLREATSAALRIVRNRDRYEPVSRSTGVPWAVIGCIHALEASLNFACHLHNGDALSARTKHAPSGRPVKGQPPFTWEESAGDALQHDGFHRISDWSLPGTLHALEGFNGWGYRQYHAAVKSPYLWAASLHYAVGKYREDGKWDSALVSQQIGCAVLLSEMARLGKITFTREGRLT